MIQTNNNQIGIINVEPIKLLKVSVLLSIKMYLLKPLHGTLVRGKEKRNGIIIIVKQNI